MTEIFKLALSLSLSGSVLATVIFACCRLMRNRLSKRFQYYIWLVVVVRLLVPFSPDSAIIPRLWEPAPPVQVMPDNTVTAPTEQQSMPPYQSQTQPAETQSRPDGIVQQPVESQPTPAAPPMPQQESSVIVLFQAVWPYLWILWLAVAAGLMIRKITLYQSFVKYLRAGRIEVDDIGTLDRFSALSEQMGVRRAIDLYTNRLTASPLMLGFRKSAVVLPEIPVNSEEFRFICLHELTHYKRGDIWYKWILQIVLCLHWFNPLVHLMVREVNRLCELSCDEAVLRAINAGEHRQYGDTLLQSLRTPGTYREGLAALTLNESARSLKERLESIMKFTKPNKATAVLAAILAALLFTGGYALGAYTMEPPHLQHEENSVNPLIDSSELDNLKPEIMIVLQELIADYDMQIDNLNFTAVPDYCVLPEVTSTDDFTLAGTETGLWATIPVTAASEWQMEVLLSNFDGVYRTEGASFKIVPAASWQRQWRGGLPLHR